MKTFTLVLSVERLNTALRLASQALDKTLTGHTLFGVYQKILVEPDTLGLKFTVVNLDYAAQIIIASYHYSAEGEMFPFSIEQLELLTLLPKLKGEVQITVEYNGDESKDKLTIVQHSPTKINYSIAISNPDNFPNIPAPETKSASVISVLPDTFRVGFDCVNHVKRNTPIAKKAADLNPTEGVRLRVLNGKIDFTAAMNALVIKWQEQLSNIATSHSIIFSSQTIAYILQATNALKGEEPWVLTIGESQFALERLVDGMIVHISANSVPGTYPDVEKFWVDFTNCLRVNRKQLLASIERASCFVRHPEGQSKTENIVRFHVKEKDKIIIRIPDKFNESLPCDWSESRTAEDITFGFNCAYLKSVLLSSDSETITWEFNTQSKPISLHCERMSAILMPTLLKEAKEAASS